MTLRARNMVGLLKLEAVSGTPENPAVTDAFLPENVRISFSPNIVNTDEVSGSLDPRTPIVGGLSAQITFDVYLKHSGTAGTAPDFGDLLKICGLQESIRAAAVPAAPEACGAGGS